VAFHILIGGAPASLDDMHICFLCDEYPPGAHGGIGTFTQTLSRALVAHGEAVTVIGVYPIAAETRERDRGVNVMRVPHARISLAGFWLNGVRLRSAIRRAHQETPIDIIEGQENSLAMLPRRFVAPKVIRMHGGHHFFSVTLGKAPRRWRSWVERRSFAHADFVCAVSRFVAERTAQLLHLDTSDIRIIHNPVDTAAFRPLASVEEDPNLLLFVGTLAEKKGVRQLIRAMPRIVTSCPDARLLLVGRDSMDPMTGGSYRASLSPDIPPALADRIIFKGLVPNPELPELLAKAAVCVYPSHMEALPIAPLEAMALGRAVLTSRTGPGPEVIQHEVSGLLCDPHDPSSIAAEAVRLLSDADFRQRLGRQARREAETRFSITTLVQENIAWYADCVARAAASVKS
jgi:glycosyltransferase involved in cell wall biosynthesis